ncbi:methyltransferase like 4 isoform X1 [Leptinotarsa decemlineata]|uniref:methyltransferase like 4 isoform X1 n=1 Tax=Leptinotarsa decemlineata TaxID=7539 RepID=UPI003D30CCB6
MSRIYENEFAIYISHEKFVNSVYNSLHKCINPNLFYIFHQYKQKKLKDSSSGPNNEPESRYESQIREQTMVKMKLKHFMSIAQSEGIFKNSLESSEEINESALRTAQTIYNETRKEMVQNAFGSNCGPPVVKDINKGLYLFPQNSTFYAKNIIEITTHLEHQTFDLILLDPPWWNKYIRRKRKATGDGYDMMFNDDLRSLPVEKLLEKDGLVVVWCTNSEQNFNHLVTKIFPKWNVEFLGVWYWLKVTTSGEPVCDFSDPPDSCRI